MHSEVFEPLSLALRLFRSANEWAGLVFLRQIVMPLATVIVVSAAYRLPLLLISPFLNAMAMDIYNWLFVLAITGAANSIQVRLRSRATLSH